MPPKKTKIDFEAELAALESLVAKMEIEMPLDEAITAYEEGIKLHAALSAQLDESEKRLRILSGGEEAEA